MKIFAGLLFPGLSLVLLSCCCLVPSETLAPTPDPAASNKTKNPAPTADPAASNKTTTVTPRTSGITVSPNNTLSAATVPGPSNITAAATPVVTDTTITTANTTIAKTNTTKTPPTSSKSPHGTSAIPKTSSTANSTAATATAKVPGNLSRSSGFDVGSFIGGIVLTLGLLIIGYIGCRTYHAKRGVQYRTIDEHDAII